MSKTYQRIAVYLTQSPNEVAVHSVNAIAERCGIARPRSATVVIQKDDGGMIGV